MCKKYLVAGAGKSGLCATALLARNHENVILFDENEKINKDELLERIECEDKTNVSVYIGNLTDEMLSDIDAMVISPGIPTDAPFALQVKEKGIPVLSEIELAYLYEKGTVVAITGTNGKTTTTTLVGEIMKAHNDKTFVVGNIGIPYTSLCDKTSADSVTVAEISSFQLETIHTFKPHVSAILNITPDHLNRHYTFENYANCKLDITKNQEITDYAIFNYDDSDTRARANVSNVKRIFFSRTEMLEEGVIVVDGNIVVREAGRETVVLAVDDIKLLGVHNLENVLAAVAMTYYMGVPVETIKKVCCEFMGVEHRIEYVKTVDGVAYYNDSKGTNPDAAIKAVLAMTQKTYLIGGGYDKKSTYDEWILSFGDKVKCLVLIGETADAISACAKSHGFTNVVRATDLEEAVKYCHANAKEGEAVLLSPACASWDMFKSYEQRGDLFKEYVRKL
ncbi:MAG: UDP-N-acetylmuramoyl-L-alanine--D-glutamate ligase [Lachnospiraceae bacterium]|nr:UDP-N-acetylmuramoyl-L-alanine--D-glutamate ligase [Lachnospiraceae bacterium]